MKNRIDLLYLKGLFGNEKNRKIAIEIIKKLKENGGYIYTKDLDVRADRNPDRYHVYYMLLKKRILGKKGKFITTLNVDVEGI